MRTYASTGLRSIVVDVFSATASAAAAGISLPYLIPSHVLGGPDRPGANEKVQRRRDRLRRPGSRIIAEAADVKAFQRRGRLRLLASRGPRPSSRRLGGGQTGSAYEDFRKMIDKEKLDAVMVETTTHARAWIAIQAMQAGMDVYIEKPMCLTIAEGRAMVNAARKYNRVTQVGTQQRSMPINNWASDLVKNGALGKVLTVIAPNFVGPERWTDQPPSRCPTAAAATGGTSGPTRPSCGRIIRELHHGWDRWWDYDGGGHCFGVTGWGTHSYDQINRGLGHRRHRPGRGAPGRAGQGDATPASSPRNCGPADIDRRRRHRHGLSRHGQARAARGPRSP